MFSLNKPVETYRYESLYYDVIITRTISTELQLHSELQLVLEYSRNYKNYLHKRNEMRSLILKAPFVDDSH